MEAATIMGIVKHFNLPVFCLYQAATVTIVLAGGNDESAITENSFTGDDGFTLLEWHLLGVYIAISAALLLNATMAARLVSGSGSRMRNTRASKDRTKRLLPSYEIE